MTARADQIDDRECLLLRAALLRDARAVSAWESWCSRFAEGREPIGQARLLPLVCRNLERAGKALPKRLKTAYATALGANARLLQLAEEVLGRLARAGIPTLVLKGTALLLLHYRDRGVRPMSDLDVLVPPARAREAFAALKDAGWRGADLESWLRAGMHAGMLGRGAGATLDLHWYASYEARFPGADDAFWAGGQDVDVGGQATKALNASDQLLHSVVHGLRWSIAPSCIWVADAATILRGGRVDPERVASRAEGVHLVRAMLDGLEQVRRLLGDEPELLAVLSRLRRARTTLGERLEQRFRVRAPGGLLGALPNLWFAYRRGEPGAGGFSGFLADTWGLERRRGLPALLARKAWRGLARIVHDVGHRRSGQSGLSGH